VPSIGMSLSSLWNSNLIKKFEFKDKDTTPMNGMTCWFPLNSTTKLKIIQEIGQNQKQTVLEIKDWVVTRHEQMSCNHSMKLPPRSI